MAKATFRIFRQRVHKILALPKGDLQHKLALRRGLKPELRELEELDRTGVYKINKPAAVHAVARKSVRVPTDYAARFSFLNAINHPVKYGATGNFSRLFFHQLLYYRYVFASGILPKLGKLCINRQDLLVLDIRGLARIQKEWLRGINCAVHISIMAAPIAHKSVRICIETAIKKPNRKTCVQFHYIS